MENYKSMPYIDFGSGQSQKSSSTTEMTEETVKQIVAQMISGISTLEFKIVETLPIKGEKKYIYLTKSLIEREEDNIYDEHIWLENVDPLKSKYETIGSTAINLDDYYTKAQIGSTIVSNIQINNKISDLYRKLILNISVKNLISEETSNIEISIPEVSFDHLDSSMNCNGLMSPNHVKSIEELESKSIEEFNLVKLIDKNVIDFDKEITYKEITDQNLVNEIFGSVEEFKRLCYSFISKKLNFVCYRYKPNSEKNLIKINPTNTFILELSNVLYLTFDYFYDTDGDQNHFVKSKFILSCDLSIENNNLSAVFFNHELITSNLVIDSLDANSNYHPLSAGQGKILNDKFTLVSNGITNLQKSFNIYDCFFGGYTKDNVMTNFFGDETLFTNLLKRIKNGETLVSYNAQEDNVFHSENVIYYKIINNQISNNDRIKFVASVVDYFINNNILVTFEYDYISKQFVIFTATKTPITV